MLCIIHTVTHNFLEYSLPSLRSHELTGSAEQKHIWRNILPCYPRFSMTMMMKCGWQVSSVGHHHRDVVEWVVSAIVKNGWRDTQTQRKK